MNLNTKSKPIRALDHIEKESPIGLNIEARTAVSEELDRHVSNMFTLFHQYQKHHWLVEGPQFRDLHLYLESSYNEVHADLDALAERMTALGCIPTSSPTAQALKSQITHESEGYFPVRQMLENDLMAEKQIIERLRKSIDRAGEHRDYATETLLKQVLMKAEDRAHHLDHYLVQDGLHQS